MNFPAIKDMLDTFISLTDSDDYLITLKKTRHAVQSMAQKLDQTNISLVFFFSSLKIDHSLGVKKRSYIDYLNEHCE